MRHAAEDSKFASSRIKIQWIEFLCEKRRSPICESSAGWFPRSPPRGRGPRRRTHNRRVGFGNSRSRVSKS